MDAMSVFHIVKVFLTFLVLLIFLLHSLLVPIIYPSSLPINDSLLTSIFSYLYWPFDCFLRWVTYWISSRLQIGSVSTGTRLRARR